MINKNSILNKAIYNSLFCHAYIMLDSNNSVIFKSPDSTSPKPISEYIKLDRDKSTFKSHRDFSSEIEITFKHF